MKQTVPHASGKLIIEKCHSYGGLVQGLFLFEQDGQRMLGLLCLRRRELVLQTIGMDEGSPQKPATYSLDDVLLPEGMLQGEIKRLQLQIKLEEIHEQFAIGEIESSNQGFEARETIIMLRHDFTMDRFNMLLRVLRECAEFAGYPGALWIQELEADANECLRNPTPDSGSGKPADMLLVAAEQEGRP